ncbi:hypothetical protein F3F43_21750 [Bacteroides ovatus]|jgi:hypothetical protein|nr:hypothetical protein F3F43_21750 [Bacteroides ovatus]
MIWNLEEIYNLNHKYSSHEKALFLFVDVGGFITVNITSAAQKKYGGREIYSPRIAEKCESERRYFADKP